MPHLSTAGVDRLHDAMATRVDKGELPGLVTLLACGDQVEVDAIGRFAYDGIERMRRDTLFRIASLTKPILATAAMMQVEAGVLGLHEPVDRLLPELADHRVLRTVDGPVDDTVPLDRPITLEDLLTNRLGFGQITEPSFDPPYPVVEAGKSLDLALNGPEPRTLWTVDEWMARFATLPLLDQPGTRWRYNTSSLVLGVLVARADGAQLGEVLRERIFAPLGMVDTGFTATADQIR
ncbi:MAG TPA: serine hydrolase domain-containing protein, partial [Micromonosporaceae bacterium]